MENSSQADPDDATDDRSESRQLTKEESDTVDRGRRGGKTQKILDDAHARDDEATARDAVSDERSRLADLDSFADAEGVYRGHGERRAASQDRTASRIDRESSADDRRQLTEDDD